MPGAGRNPAAADDLVQELPGAGRQPLEQRREGDPRPVAVHRSCTTLRSTISAARRRGKHITIDEADEDDFGQDAVQEQKLMYQDVLDKLARLPEDQRAVLLLFAGGRPVICDACEGARHSFGTVMSRLSRAREKCSRKSKGLRRRAEKRGAVAEHEMSNRPITEDDLHAYVDGVLEPEREAEVAAIWKATPTWPGASPPFRTSAISCARRWRPSRTSRAVAAQSVRDDREAGDGVLPVWWAVAAMLMLSIGGLGGWVMRAACRARPADLPRSRRKQPYSYSVYAPDRVRPVEMRASDSAQLVQWVSNRLKQPVKLPDLTGSGYRLMGGR
jgi:DNA-directed RNA polymerase specialized sigma24 family protein